jgi:signal transduction histidine kinase
MTNDFERKAQILEEEIKKRDQIIEHLHKNAILDHIALMYLHETNSVLSTLSMYLTQLFSICHAKNIAETLILQITNQFELLRDINNSFRFLTGENQLVKNATTVINGIQELEKLFKPLLQRQNISLNIRLYEEATYHKVPISEFRLILTNILSNLLSTLQYVQKKDKNISIEVSCDKMNTILIISNNEVGIPQEVIDKIWSPYFITWRQKIGLGLYIAKIIIEKIGGDIFVESDGKEFTRFKITIPLLWENGTQ